MFGVVACLALCVVVQTFALDTEPVINRQVRVATADKNKRWPSKTIPYTIDSNFDASQQAAIKNEMAAIQGKTCVTFAPRNGEKDYVSIRKVSSGCYSYVGRIGGATRLHLSSQCFDNSFLTIAHEIMHVLGFFHEHQRPDRDNFITINWDNIPMSQRHSFKIKNGETFGLPYDIHMSHRTK